MNTQTKNQKLTALRLTDDDISVYKEDPELLSPQSLKGVSCVIFPTHIMFFNDFIYEFKIDFYKTGTFEGEGFYEYCTVKYDDINNNYKIYGYYSCKGKFHPTKPTRNGEYDIIELDKSFSGHSRFKGPRFTEGPRRGQYDTWILNTSQIYSLPLPA